MHAIPRHENEEAPCNIFCCEDVHTDLIFLAPYVIEQAGADLRSYVRTAWRRLGYTRTSEVLNLRPAPEAQGAEDYYPRSYAVRPESTLPYRITYRVYKEKTSWQD